MSIWGCSSAPPTPDVPSAAFALIGCRAHGLALACAYCNCDLKGTWNPNPNAETLTRTELVERVKKYLQEIEPVRYADLQEDREIIGYARLADRHPLS